MNFDFESFFHLIKKCLFFFAVRKIDLNQLNIITKDNDDEDLWPWHHLQQ